MIKHVLIKKGEGEYKTPFSIFIPNAAAAKLIQGKVIAAGAWRTSQDCQLCSLDVKAGDRVLFDKHVGKPVMLNGEELLIIRESDIISVVGC